MKARQIIRKLMREWLRFEPDPVRSAYTITGEVTYGRLLAATVGHLDRWCPRGGLLDLGQPIRLELKTR